MANQALTTPPSTPPHSSQQQPFDITAHYNKLVESDSKITLPIAAIESLISVLSSSPLQTVSETLSLISTASNTLLSTQRNPLPVSAGTDLFQRYLITSFNQSPLSSQSGSDFTTLRNQLITNSKLFVARAKQAKSKIAHHALSSLFGPTDDTEFKTTVITYASSRLVDGILRLAAEKSRWFNVIFIESDNARTNAKNESTIQALRKSHVPVATISISSFPLVLSTLSSNSQTKSASSTFLILGTSAVLENGSVVSEVGSSLVSSIAHSHGLPVYITAESFKFARQFPIGCSETELRRMGVTQDVLRFTPDDLDSKNEPSSEQSRDMVDITSSDLITGLVTETGMLTPNAMTEELIKLWF